MNQAATKILSDWSVDTMQQLCDGLKLLLDNVGETLVDFASKTESFDLQTTFFDAQHLLTSHEASLLANFRDELEREEFKVMEQQPAIGGETLSLLERDAYERSVALETIANNCVLRNQQNYHALKQRMSAIHGGRIFQVDDLPLNPRLIANVFEKVFSTVDISSKVRLVLFTLFDRYVMYRLDDALSEINQLLAEAGVLPTVKFTVKKQGASTAANVPADPDEAQPEGLDEDTSRPAQKYAPPEAADFAPQPAAGPEGGDSGPAPTAQQTMQAITQLVTAQRRRQRYKELSSSGGGTPAPTISPQESQRRVLQALNSPQIAQQAPTPAPQVLTASDNKIIIDKELLLRVRNTLKKQRALINSLMGGGKNIGEREQNAIDIVGMLFEAMLDDKTLPDQLKALLSHLHTPFLKIAIKDPECLTDTNHPARKILGLMLQTGLRWVDPERLRSGIYPTLQYCVRKIIDSPEQVDYQHLEGELARKVTQLEQAKKVSEKRTLDAEKGKTMLARARDTAESATTALLKTHSLPAGVRIFFQTVFADYMSLLLLRNNLDPKHPKCTEALGAAVQLIESVDKGDVPEAAQAGEDLKQLVLQLLPHYQDKIDQFLGKLGDSITHAERVQPELEAVATQPAEEQYQTSDEAAAKVLEIPVGTWFRLQENPAEQPLMVKLLWANPHTEHVLFVDQHGMKRAMLSLREAAADLDSGVLKQVELEPEGMLGKLLLAMKRRLESTLATGTDS
jgi:hypothetical protein